MRRNLADLSRLVARFAVLGLQAWADLPCIVTLAEEARYIPQAAGEGYSVFLSGDFCIEEEHRGKGHPI